MTSNETKGPKGPNSSRLTRVDLEEHRNVSGKYSNQFTVGQNCESLVTDGNWVGIVGASETHWVHHSKVLTLVAAHVVAG